MVPVFPLLPLALVLLLLRVLARVNVAAVAQIGHGAELRRGRTGAARAVALVRRRARCLWRYESEATAGARVVELVEGTVLVLADKGLVGGEERIGTVGADPHQAHNLVRRAVVFADSRADQLRATVDVLIDVDDSVGVPGHQRTTSREEHPAVVGHEASVEAAFH